MYTIKQIADELGVTKQAIQKRIAREPLKTHLIKHIIIDDTGTKRIDDDGAKLIKDVYTTIDKPIDISVDKGTDTLNTLISMLQNELEIKNAQIETLSAALVAAQQTAQAAQTLHAGTIQAQLTSEQETEVSPEKISLWGRVFRRRK